jgi:hypothetical protein
MTDPRTPLDEVAIIAKRLEALQDQVNELKAPSGTSAFQTVSKLQSLINNIQAQLDDYIANGTYNKAQIDDKLASPGNISPGSVSASGNITTAGLFFSPAAYSTLVGATRAALWVDNTGRIGRT